MSKDNEVENGRIVNKSLGVSFILPERISVRQQLRYRQAIAFNFDVGPDGEIRLNNNDMYERYWKAMPIVVEDWQCEIIPDMAKLDLDEADDPRIADIVFWAANEVVGHMSGLRSISKNL